MNREVKQIFKILLRHLIIGALGTVLFFWSIGELPDYKYFLSKLHILSLISFLLTLITWLVSKTVFIQITNTNRNKFFVAFVFIFFSWTILFLLTAISDGLESSIKEKRFEIINSIEGYAIYRLWAYWGVAIIHGLIGGSFLAVDLKRQLKLSGQLAKENKSGI